jgi:hypothetical protein
MGAVVPMIGSAALGQLMTKTPLGTIAGNIPGVGGMITGATDALGGLTPGFNSNLPHPMQAALQQIPGMKNSPFRLLQQKQAEQKAKKDEEFQKLQEENDRLAERLKSYYDLGKPTDDEGMI